MSPLLQPPARQFNSRAIACGRRGHVWHGHGTPNAMYRVWEPILPVGLRGIGILPMEHGLEGDPKREIMRLGTPSPCHVSTGPTCNCPAGNSRLASGTGSPPLRFFLRPNEVKSVCRSPARTLQFEKANLNPF